MSKNRLKSGLIDKTKEIHFSFNGRNLIGFKGDTLASALFANGVFLVGRSFKYHRPRGIISAGSEEPNGIVTIKRSGSTVPNVQATTLELYQGLEAFSQNCWPSVENDFLAVNDLIAPFLTAGFYYKTFMWPKSFWEAVYEPIIRRAAGLGALSTQSDPDEYDKGFLHCDLLVVGAGVAGLWTAWLAAKAGVNVLLVDEDFLPGGRALSETEIIDGTGGAEWAAKILDELNGLSNFRYLSRTTVYGTFDHGIFGALERVTDHLLTSPEGKPRQTLWRIYSKASLICSGATERLIAFANNDRPGIIQAGALRSYVNRWSVKVRGPVVVFSSTDDGERTVKDLLEKGVSVRALIDPRTDQQSDSLEDIDVEVFRGAKVVDTFGRRGITQVKLETSTGEHKTLDCSFLAVSGGWNPNIHLTSHHRERPVWSERIHSFLAAENLPNNMTVAGAASGDFLTSEIFNNSAKKVEKIIKSLGFSKIKHNSPTVENSISTKLEDDPLWYVPYGNKRAWVDFQNDVTVKDIKLSHQEGFISVEHLKRYTTLGMATDQGKNSNVVGLAVMAEATGKSIEETGTTIFRPPYNPVPIGAFAGRSRDKDFRPVRLTPSHKWAEENGAVFVEAGQWLRAQYFPRDGESHWRQSVDREVLQTRSSVGICDVSTLGKIDIQGKDSVEFINRVYSNGFAKLPVGKTRYGLMLREDGIVMDDGTTARLGENHFVMTTTTANAVGVFRHLEFCRQCLWPDLDVHLISTTESWAQFAIAGPNSRKLLSKVVDKEFDISNDSFPFMACKELTVFSGCRARLFRISFSGELAYEVAVPSRFGYSMMSNLLAVGKEFDAVPYGTEALGVMRIEKGHAAGNELNGQTTARDLGMGALVSAKKDSIGAVLSRREGLNLDDGYSLVGFKPVNTEDTLTAGSHIFSEGAKVNAKFDQGYLTSAAYSPILESSIAIGFLKKGNKRKGEQVRIINLLANSNIKAEVVSAHFVDPEGEKLRG